MEIILSNTELEDSILRGKNKVDMAAEDMPALLNIKDSLREKPYIKNLNILGCVTVTPETANLILTLNELGVKSMRWCSDNQFFTDDDVANYLRSLNLEVFGKSNMSDQEYEQAMESACAFTSDEIAEGITAIDDGCDITSYLVGKNPAFLQNINLLLEQTTCGVSRLKQLYAKSLVPCPAININDSFAKSFFDNFYGVPESFLHGLMTAFPRQLAGKIVAIYGYGPVGNGTAKALRHLGAQTLVIEAVSSRQAQALYDGNRVEDVNTALRIADIHVLATGCKHVLSQEDMQKAKNGALFCNIGHGNEEFDHLSLAKSCPQIPVNEHLSKMQIGDGKSIFIMSQGALANFGAGKGNPPRMMSLTFVLHMLAIDDHYTHPGKYERGLFYNTEHHLSERALALNNPELESKRVNLTDVQKIYLATKAYDLHMPQKGYYTQMFNQAIKRPDRYALEGNKLPTPIVHIPAMSKDFNINLFAKMECFADQIGGGNKVRKLSYFIPYVKEQGITDLIIDGTDTSNSCMALAFYARRNGLRTHCILSGPNFGQGNQSLISRYADSVVHIGEWNPSEINAQREKLKGQITARGGTPYNVPTGVSNSITAFAGLELMEETLKQSADMKLQFNHIVLPVGTGSTLAGCHLAQNLYRPPWEIHGVAIANDEEYFRSDTHAVCMELTQNGYGDFQKDSRGIYKIWTEALGEGYLQLAPEDRKKICEIEEKTGIYFDGTYTYKGLKGIGQMVEAGVIEKGQNVLFVHTGGLNDRFINHRHNL